MWRLIFILHAALIFTLAQPGHAATRLVAPATVSDMLQRHLTLDEQVADAQDDMARTTLERRLEKEASELLATEGYFSPSIDLRSSNEGLVLQVDPGTRAKIGTLHIEIRGPLAADRKQMLIKDWALPSASAFSQSAWNEAKQGLLRDLMMADHAAARLLSSQAEVDVETARVDLQLIYDAGPKYRYGEIRVIGLKRYSESLVKRYSEQLHPGDAYQQKDLLAVQAALQNTPYFSSVSVELEHDPLPLETDASSAELPTQPDDETVHVPVIIRLSERAPFNVALGAGFSSNTGARVEGNFRNSDFFGRGWELSTGARVEQLRQGAYADIFLPPDRKQQRDSVGSIVEKSDIQGLGIERVAFAVSRVQLRGRIEQRLGLNWQHEQQSPNGVPSSVNRALTASVGWLWRYADDPLDASEGIVAQLQLGGAAKAVLSDQNFLRSYFRYSQGIPLGKSDGLLLRGEVGITAAPSRQGIPQDYLFRAGGSNSVRGYAYQSLGVQEGSTTLGGRYLLTVSAEYTHWINDQWGIATFVDAGQAADDRKVFKLAQGYGVGARWKSPAGPLAIDLAWGKLDKKVRLHFSLAVPF